MIPLPQHHHQDDTKWIAEQLGKLPFAMRERACKGYSEVYAEIYNTFQDQPFGHCRARFAANTRLREFVGRVLKSVSAAETSIPIMGGKTRPSVLANALGKTSTPGKSWGKRESR